MSLASTADKAKIIEPAAFVDKVSPKGIIALLIAFILGVAIPAGIIYLRELLRNPLIIATVSGLAANLAGLHIPGWMAPTVSRIGNAALVLGLMAAGAGMQWGHLQHTRLLSVLLLGIRHLLLPLLAWAVARLLGLDATQTTVLLAFSALPTASSCYVLAARMGYNGPYVAGLVTLSTLLALASLPFALGLPR